MLDTIKVGRNGAMVIPTAMRRRLGLAEGGLVLIEDTSDGLSIRPAMAIPVEIYTPERKAMFLLENAVDRADYESALEAVRAMGLDPEAIDHRRPSP